MYSKSQKSHAGVPVNRDFLCLDSLSSCITSTTDFIFYGILHKKPIKHLQNRGVYVIIISWN